MIKSNESVKSYTYVDEKTQEVYEISIYLEKGIITMITPRNEFFSANLGNIGIMPFLANASKDELLEKIGGGNPSIFNLNKSKELTIDLLNIIANRLEVPEEETKQIEELILNSRATSKLEFGKDCYNHLRAFSGKLFARYMDIIYYALDYPPIVNKLVTIIMTDMRTLLPRCPDLLPNNVICDIYEKDKKHIFGDDPALPVNQRLIEVNNMYAWLYNRGILEKISSFYKNYDTATYFSFETRDLRPYMAEMVNSGVEGMELAMKCLLYSETAPCLYSGTIQPGYIMSTYRDNCGCVGRSHECMLIQELDTASVHFIYSMKEKYGIHTAVDLLFRISLFN